MIGTVAFAVSGSMTAVRKNMDLFGVMILGVITACGGGLTRDILLGITPPALFGTPKYVTVAAATAILVFIPGVRRWLMKSHRGFERILLLMDSIGLGVFTMVGMQAAYGCGVECSTFLAVSVGVITGVGGGVMRDVMAGDRPYIFVKHIYACAAILGAMLFAVLRGRCGDTAAILAGAALVILIRLLSA
ncbi:MAG: TRIC cation channel family protein, partial [Clostridium sp.]|nr:TRIC cation channel family protein [Clostridium sp.]